MSTLSIPKDLNDGKDLTGGAFERMCLTIFRHHFDAPDANFYGRNSTGQDGIDLWLTTVIGGRRTRVLIQCKDTVELTFTTIEVDLRNALSRFTRELEQDPGLDLFFLVASTVEQPRSDDLVNKATAMVEKMIPQKQLRSRFRFDAFGWKWISTTVRDNPVLAQVFLAPDLPGDAMNFYYRDRARTKLQEALARNQLASGREALIDWFHNDKISQPEEFQWVCKDMVVDVLSLYLRAGDFARVDRLLDKARALHRYDARFILAHLRARRVLNMFARDTTPRSPVQVLLKSKAPAPIEEEVAVVGAHLNLVQGNVDSLLTLCFWIITYSQTYALADRALLMARALVNHAWPSDVEPLNPNADYRFWDDSNQLMVWRDDHWSPAVDDQHGSERAIALLLAHHYLRGLHEARFGQETTESLEGMRDGAGWPRSISYSQDWNAPPMNYSHVRPGHRMSLQANLPLFSDEWDGASAGFTGRTEYTDQNEAQLTGFGIVCCVSLLLRDCRERRLQARIGALRQGMAWAGGTKLWLSHHALERIARVKAALDICTAVSDASAHLYRDLRQGLDELTGLVSRAEIGVGGESASPIFARPVYADFDHPEIPGEARAAITLSNEKRMDLIVAELNELEEARTYLDQGRNIVLYWWPRGGLSTSRNLY